MGRNEPSHPTGGPSSGFPSSPRLYRFRTRLWLPSTNRSMNLAVREVRTLAKKCGCTENRLADIEISVREAVANAIIHGNGRRREQRILFRCYGDPDHGILITVRDSGPGFDPSSVPDPREEDRLALNHGRGLFLMRELMDHVEYRRGGSEVLLYAALGGD